MKSLLEIVILIIIILSLSTCYYNKEEILYQDKSCDTTNITYIGKIDTIFSKKTCFSCHASTVAPPDGGGLQLDKYAIVKANINRVIGAITHQPGFKSMPLGQSETIDPCSINIIQLWKAAGMPEGK